MSNSDLALIEQVFKKILHYETTDADYSYRHLLAGVTVIILIYYVIRSIQLTRLSSSAVKFFGISVMLLCGWNLLLSAIADKFIINLPGVFQKYQVLKISQEEIFRKLSSHQFNQQLIRKNLKQFLLIVESLLIFKCFTVGIEKAVNYIRTITKYKGTYWNDNEIYSDNELSYKTTQITSDHFKFKGPWIYDIIKSVLKYSLQFILLSGIFVLVLPNHLLMNSVATVYSSENLVVKFDHFIWALNILLLRDNIKKILKTMGTNSLSECPSQFILLGFSWLYNCLLLVLSSTLMVLFHDILINLLFVMVNNLLDNHQFNNYNINVFTLMLLSYFYHASDDSCLHKVCSTTEKIDVMAKSFVAVKNLFANCLVVLNFSCFVVIPFIIWVLLIECKLERLSCQNSNM